jgi:hypothetical protein
MQQVSRILGCEDGCQSRPILGRGQAPRVAMRQDALSRAEQFRPVAANRMAHLPVLGVNLNRGLQQALQQVFTFDQLGCAGSRSRSPHSIKRPEQIDGRRPTGCKVIADLIKQGLGCGGRQLTDRLQVLLHAGHNTIGGGDANRRCAADFQLPNRFPDGLYVGTGKFEQLSRQSGLVKQPELTVSSALPANRAGSGATGRLRVGCGGSRGDHRVCCG